MFSDPKKVKDIKLAVRLCDYEHEKLTHLANALSEHPSTLARKLFMQQVEELYEAIQDVETEQLQSIVQSSACAVQALKVLISQPINDIVHLKYA